MVDYYSTSKTPQNYSKEIQWKGMSPNNKMERNRNKEYSTNLRKMESEWRSQH